MTDDDLDRTMDYGFARRVLASIVADSVCKNPFSSDPLVMAHELGRTQFGRELDDRIRRICPEKWLIMQRELLNTDEDDDKEPPRDGP